MKVEFNGTELLTQMAIDQANEYFTSECLKGPDGQVFNGETAISKLIEEKCASKMPQREAETNYPQALAALQLIKWAAEGRYSGYHYLDPTFYFEELEDLLNNASDEFMTECWDEHTIGTRWTCITEEEPAVSDGAEGKKVRWLVCPPQKMNFAMARETIVNAVIASIDFRLTILTKHLYLEVSLQEWVDAYDADTQKKNNPAEIEERMRKLLM